MSLSVSFAPFLAMAQETDSQSAEQPHTTVVSPAEGAENCFLYYQPWSIDINLQPVKSKFQAGEQALFSGFIQNNNDFPITNGTLILRLSRADKLSPSGYTAIEQWAAEKNLKIPAQGKIDVSETYQFPSGLTTGEYLLGANLTEGDQYDIGGFSLFGSEQGRKTEFSVEGVKNNGLVFNEDKIEINGEASSGKPLPEETKDIVVSIPLKNDTGEEADISITAESYSLSSIFQKNLAQNIISKETLGKGEQKRVLIGLSLGDKPVLEVRFKAEGNSSKAESYVKMARLGLAPEVSFAGVQKFPVKKNGENKVFACVKNESGESAGKVVLILQNEKGKTVAEKTYEGKISSSPLGLAEDISKKELDKLSVLTNVYNTTGKLVLTSKADYDCADFGNCLPEDKGKTIVIIGLVALVLIAGGFLIAEKRRENNK